jgi:tight adherence protein B
MFSPTILFFVVTFALVAAAVWVARMIMDRVSGEPKETEEAALPIFLQDEASLLLDNTQVSSISLWAWLLSKFDVIEKLKLLLTQADLKWSVGRVTLSMLFCGTCAMALLNQFRWMPFWGLALMSALAGMIPYSYIVRRKESRWRMIEEQLADALESMARSMRAGHPFAAALDNVANQTPNPLGKELKRTYSEGAFGAPWEQALDNLCERLPLQEVCMFASAVQMQSKSGGNLSEVLEKLAENMREAAALRGEVRSLSAQGRTAGYILSTLPFAIAALTFVVNPNFMDPLFTEEIGRIALTCCLLGLVLAHFVIRKLVDIKL